MENGQELPKETKPTINSVRQKAVFFKGESVSPTKPKIENPISIEASKHLDSLFERMEKGAKGDLIFDIDGVLTEISLETAANPKLLNVWTEENKGSIGEFKHKIDYLKNTGKFRLALCTGRGWDYAHRIGDILFSEGSLDYVVAEGGVDILSAEAPKPSKAPKDKLNYAICEGGALVCRKLENDKWELKPASSVNKEDLDNLNKYRSTITEYALGMGGFLEPKRIRLTLNPPEGKTGEEFEVTIKVYLNNLAEENPQDREILEKISNNMTHTPTTVEIMPAGVNKLKTLLEIAENNVKFYFGDANTDKGAMEGSDVNIAPSNSEIPIKNYVKGDEARSFFGILPDKNTLEGVNDSLKSIITYYRLKNIEDIRKNKRKA